MIEKEKPGTNKIFTDQETWFQLKLFVAGASPNSTHAMGKLKCIFQKYLIN